MTEYRICTDCGVDKLTIHFYPYFKYGEVKERKYSKACLECIEKRRKEVPSKICTSCKVEKTLDNFHKMSNGLGGRRSVCIECNKVKYTEKIRIAYPTNPTLEKYQCRQCEEIKSIKHFNKKASNITGYDYICKVCSRLNYASLYGDTRKKKRIASRDTALRKMISDARWRAKKKNIPFDITVADLVFPDSCPILGLPMAVSNLILPRDNSPTLDKIIPSVGYIKGNVRVISFLANRLKSDCTNPDVFFRIGNYLKEALENTKE